MPHATERGAVATARAIADGTTSALAECEAAIDRIEERDAAINAVVVRDFERARQAAQTADRAIAAGERRPLLGVPMTVKESHNVAGLPTTWGFPEHHDYVPARDGVTVARLKAAGAIILGKTNVPVALGDWQSANPIYGRTNNPHDHGRSPGGSSGGSAAALAAGMVPLGMGSDIGGSIRIPAHFCGVFGHKPTYGAVPLEGHSFPRTNGADIVLAVVGPLARFAEDLAVALDVVSEIILPRAQKIAPELLRLLVLTEPPVAPLDAGIRHAIEHAAALFATAGARIEKRTDRLPDLEADHHDYVRLLGIAVGRGAGNDGEEPVLASQWFELLDRQARCSQRWRALFEEFDAVLAPVFGTVAFPHSNEPELGKRSVTVNGKTTPVGAQLAWAGLATYSGLPATAVPIGRDPAGLPIGMQIIAPRFQDHRAIELAGWIHEASR